MTNRDEILKALQATGMSQADAEALLELSDRMKGTLPPPQPKTVEDAVAALYEAIERSKKDGVPLKNPISPKTRGKAVERLENLMISLAANGIFALLVHNWAHLKNFFNDARPESDERTRAGLLYQKSNRLTPFKAEIADIPWDEKRRLAKFAAELIARELHEAFGPESELEEEYLKIFAEASVSNRLFGDTLEQLPDS
jgi:hypothetical protein